MKTLSYIKGIMATTAFILLAAPANAQINPDTYFNADWQINIPLSNGFGDNSSGWGANFEGGYYLSPYWAIGGFLSYHTNHEYLGRNTIQLNGNMSVNTDQEQSLFQMPFGISSRYRLSLNKFQPYIGSRTGVMYARMSSNFNIYEDNKNTWGFFTAPEIGFNYYPWANTIGFHAAIYYNFSTNKGSLMGSHIKNLNNLGFRFGVAF